MNEVIKALLERRSIRRYTDEQVSEEQLQQVLTAARYAPSGSNTQLWHFLAIQQREVLDELNARLQEVGQGLTEEPGMYSGRVGFIRSAKSGRLVFAHNAPTLIIASCDRSHPNAMADCSLALSNMFHAAYALGLGSCWINSIAWYGDAPSIRPWLEEMGLPKTHVICGSCALGYADGPHPKAAPRKEGTVTIIR